MFHKGISPFWGATVNLKQGSCFHRSIASNFETRAQKIYHTLLEQTEQPIACNFMTQLVDEWAIDKQRLAIRSIDQDSGRLESITYSRLVYSSKQIAAFFQQEGFRKGDSVALMLGQQSAWWFALAGLLRSGLAIVPCPRLLTVKDLTYRINDLKIKGIVTLPEFQTRVDALRKDCPSLTSCVTTGFASYNWASLQDIYESNSVSLLSPVETTTQDPCLYLYTSGTTGQPKAVVHHHDYPFFHWPTGKRWLAATAEDVIFNASDTGWGFTAWITLAAWSMGAKLLIAPTNKKFDPQKVLALLREQPITIFCAAPTVLRLLAAQQNFDNFSFPHLKRIITVGEALDETVIHRFQSRGIEVRVGFGQAETPPLLARVDNQLHIPNTMGQPLDPYRIVILDDNLKPLPPGNTGQIAVDLISGKRSGIMRGYANAPDKTQKAFSPDGRYYLTGDWAKYSEGGLFYYQGRKDDLIKSRGYRVGPDEVEKAGMSHPAVAKIAVVGIPTEYRSLTHTIKAFILLKPSYEPTPELIKSIQEHIKQETAPHKYPRLVECLNQKEWEQFETISGKIRRMALRDREEQKLKEAKETEGHSHSLTFKK
jgi:acyl-coenzyme A synthetase/AMP-(fatty) acid ligase